ncbi:MAG: ATP-dependent DNA helicase RecG [Anaerolineae bacterium]|nr:ATP-dependent DNA helicase RecG [Anaerolineae bacterium]
MASAFERLAKILDLERKNGYKNRAVIGGLEKFLPGWATTAMTEPGGAALVERVNAALGAYGSRSPEERAAAIKALLQTEGGSTSAKRRREESAPQTASPSEAERKNAAGRPPARSISPANREVPDAARGKRRPETEPDDDNDDDDAMHSGRPLPKTALRPTPQRGADNEQGRGPKPGPAEEKPGEKRGGRDEARQPNTPFPRTAENAPKTARPEDRGGKAGPAQDKDRPSPPRPSGSTPAPRKPTAPPSASRGGEPTEASERPPGRLSIPPLPISTANRPVGPESEAAPMLTAKSRREGGSSEALEGIPSLAAAPVAVADPPPLPRAPTIRRGPQATIAPTGDLDGPVTQIPGISTVYAKHLARLGVQTIRDLLFLIPRRYDDFSQLKTIHQLVYGEEATVVGTVQNTTNRRSPKGMMITTCVLSDATGYIQATWFNQPYLLQQLRPGRQIVLSGRIDAYLGKLVLQSPEWEPLDQDLVHTARLVPVYPLTQGIGPRWMRTTLKRVVDAYSSRLTDPLPDGIREAQALMPLADAVRQVHFPDDQVRLAQSRHRLAFDEFFVIQLGVLRQRRLWQSNEGRALPLSEDVYQSFLQSLPFSLTGAQQRVLDEIRKDMNSTRPMSRLLQGDVGSGKTVVAAAAMVAAWANGMQAALMAPTEILAEQHAKGLRRLFRTWAETTGQSAPPVELLTGSLTKAEREAAYQAVASGESPFVVGTHAVIQSGVEFANLGLAIVDEQHRFGVGQRAALRQKGTGTVPHLLVMTATPIPRTLALTVYGDLDLSIINELPPGRTPIKTKWVLPRERERAYSFVAGQIQQGRQAFIICPLIEESENLEVKAAVQEYERLQQEVFPHLRLGLLHGKLRPAEKEAVMAEFYRGDLHILVSTSVVEVGIDVPNTTVMLIEGANRFGLAQLHQFRGRVGRGQYQSYCLLVADENIGEDGKTRLEAMERTQDGFELAEEDLKLRGPGEFFGTRQSGLPDLAVAKLSDVQTLEQARGAAESLFEQDPDISAPEHRGLRAAVDKFWSGQGDLS